MQSDILLNKYSPGAANDFLFWGSKEEEGCILYKELGNAVD